MKQTAVEESCASESSADENMPKKKGQKFTVNTNYCRSELELL